MTQKKKVAAIFLLRPDGSALLQLRDDIPTIPHPGKWTIPGGHCEPNESWEDCIKREVFEETAYVCHEVTLIASFLHDDGFKGAPYELTVFWAPYDETQTYRCLEGQELRFTKREEAGYIPILEFLLPLWDKAIQLQQRSP